ASSSLLPKLCVKVLRELSNPNSQIVACMWSPTFQRRLQFETLRITHRAIQSNPCHDLRQGKVAATASHLPNSIVRLLPDLFQMLDQGLLQRPGRLDGSKSVLSRLEDGVHEFAVHVELQLTGGGVADAHGRGTLVAREPRHLPFSELSFAGEAVHNLELVRA